MQNQPQIIGNIPIEPTVQPLPESPQPKNRITTIVIIILAILALGGIGFGIYAYFFRQPSGQELSVNCPECKKCEESTTPNQNSTETPIAPAETPNIEEFYANIEGADKVALVKDSLDRYGITIETPRMNIFDNVMLMKYLRDPSEENREKYFYSSIIYFKEAKDAFSVPESQVPKMVAELTYDEVNDIYHKYFGENTNLSKTNREWTICGKESAIYSEENDSVTVTIGNGCGGTGPKYIHFRIDYIRESGEAIIVKLNSVMFNIDPTAYNAEYMEKTEKEILESSMSRLITMQKQGDYYVITNITE